MNDAQWHFVHSEILTLSVMAALARANIYAKRVADIDRHAVRSAVKPLLRELAPQYASAVEEEQHLQNIQRLAAAATKKHASVLSGGAFRIWPAQKALNLYLKYLLVSGSCGRATALPPRRSDTCQGSRWRPRSLDPDCQH